MTESNYPSLSVMELLEFHGLRAAYVIVMLGSTSWDGFVWLHDNVIPEECRLPRSHLSMLVHHYGRLMGTGRRNKRHVLDADLLKEFNCARHWTPNEGTLNGFYARRLAARADATRRQMHWSVGSESGVEIRRRDVHSDEARSFIGSWEGFENVRAEAKIVEVGDEMLGHEDPGPARRRLLIDLSLRSALTEATVDRVLAVTSWQRVSAERCPGCAVISYLLENTVGQHTFPGRDGHQRSLVLTDDGHRALAQAFASIGFSPNQP